MAELIPHLEWPLRVVGGSLAVHDQDSDADVLQCVEVVLLTEEGERLDIPDFGVAGLVFGQVSTGEIRAEVERWEPRAEAYVTAAPDPVDELIRRVHVEVA